MRETRLKTGKIVCSNAERACSFPVGAHSNDEILHSIPIGVRFRRVCLHAFGVGVHARNERVRAFGVGECSRTDGVSSRGDGVHDFPVRVQADGAFLPEQGAGWFFNGLVVPRRTGS